MQKNIETLQEIQELLQEQFPRIDKLVFTKIIFSIKARSKKYWIDSIIFSKYEFYKFWVWEKTLFKIIKVLRDFWILEFVKKRRSANWLTNFYQITKEFLYLFDDLIFYTKKIFQYIKPLEFCLQHFKLKQKSSYYEFKYNWIKYKISKFWKFAWKIFNTKLEKIVSPLSIL